MNSLLVTGTQLLIWIFCRWISGAFQRTEMFYKCIGKWIRHHCTGRNWVTQYIHCWALICKLCFLLCYPWCELLWWCWYICKRKNGKCVYWWTPFDDKTCHCVKCKTESLFVRLIYNNVSFIVGWIYRHPNRNSSNFVNDLDRSLAKYW